MIRPTTPSKVLLLADRRIPPSTGGSPAVRRYRLARLRLDGRPVNAESPFEYLKRVYD